MEPVPKIEEYEKQKVFTVAEFIDFLNTVLVPHRAVIKGEIGKDIYSRDRYAIFYLLDKNEEAILKCFGWQNRLEDSGIELKEGIEVKVLGYPQIYKPKGEISLEVERIGLVGEGALKKAFEILKKKLIKAGFFDLKRKKPIPRFCQKIGLITSQYGKGALPDFLKHLGSYGFRVYFYDARVEGLSAIEDITRAIRWFNESMLDIEVLVLIRGGGSWESLQPFNSESVAKAIFASKVPIICGIGHERDETIADYVADCRASTPTHAARIISDPWKLAGTQINFFQKNILVTFKNIFRNKANELFQLERFLKDLFKRNLVMDKRKIREIERNLILRFESFFKDFEKIEHAFWDNFQIFQILAESKYSETRRLKAHLIKESNKWLKVLNRELERTDEILNSLNPKQKLKQGYSIVFDEASREIIKNVKQLKVGSKTKTKFYRGSAFSRVEKVSKSN